MNEQNLSAAQNEMERQQREIIRDWNRLDTLSKVQVRRAECSVWLSVAAAVVTVASLEVALYYKLPSQLVAPSTRCRELPDGFLDHGAPAAWTNAAPFPVASVGNSSSRQSFINLNFTREIVANQWFGGFRCELQSPNEVLDAALNFWPLFAKSGLDAAVRSASASRFDSIQWQGASQIVWLVVNSLRLAAALLALWDIAQLYLLFQGVIQEKVLRREVPPWATLWTYSRTWTVFVWESLARLLLVPPLLEAAFPDPSFDAGRSLDDALANLSARSREQTWDADPLFLTRWIEDAFPSWYAGTASLVAYLTCLSLLRVALALPRYIYYSSELLQPHGQFISRLTWQRPTLAFVTKKTVHESPLQTTAGAFIALTLLAGYCLRTVETIECLAYPELRCVPLSYFEATYTAFISFVTVGYGAPFVPKGSAGRLVVLVGSILALVITSVAVSVVILWFRFSAGEDLLHVLIRRFIQRGRKEARAALAIQEAWRQAQQMRQSLLWAPGVTDGVVFRPVSSRMETEAGALQAVHEWRKYRSTVKRSRLDAEVSAKQRLLSTWAVAYMEDIGEALTGLSERLVPEDQAKQIQDILSRRDSMCVGAPLTPKKSRVERARSSLWGQTKPFLPDGWESDPDADSASEHGGHKSPSISLEQLKPAEGGALAQWAAATTPHHGTPADETALSPFRASQSSSSRESPRAKPGLSEYPDAPHHNSKGTMKSKRSSIAGSVGRRNSAASVSSHRSRVGSIGPALEQKIREERQRQQKQAANESPFRSVARHLSHRDRAADQRRRSVEVAREAAKEQSESRSRRASSASRRGSSASQILGSGRRRGSSASESRRGSKVSSADGIAGGGKVSSADGIAGGGKGRRRASSGGSRGGMGAGRPASGAAGRDAAAALAGEQDGRGDVGHDGRDLPQSLGGGSGGGVQLADEPHSGSSWGGGGGDPHEDDDLARHVIRGSSETSRSSAADGRALQPPPAMDQPDLLSILSKIDSELDRATTQASELSAPRRS